MNVIQESLWARTRKDVQIPYSIRKKKSYADQRKRENHPQKYIDKAGDILLNRHIGLLMWKQERSK